MAKVGKNRYSLEKILQGDTLAPYLFAIVLSECDVYGVKAWGERRNGDLVSLIQCIVFPVYDVKYRLLKDWEIPVTSQYYQPKPFMTAN